MKTFRRLPYSDYTGHPFNKENLLNDLMSVHYRQSPLKPYSRIIFEDGNRLEIRFTGVETVIKNPSLNFLGDVVKKYLSRKRVSLLQISDLYRLSVSEEGLVDFQFLLDGKPLDEKNEKYVAMVKNEKEFKRMVKKWENIASKLEIPLTKNILGERISTVEIQRKEELREGEILPYALHLLKSLKSLNSTLKIRYKLPVIQEYISGLVIQPTRMRLWSSYKKEELEFALSLLDLRKEPKIEVMETDKDSDDYLRVLKPSIGICGCGNEVRRLNIYCFQKQKKEGF